MGYTHYWRQKRAFTENEWAQICGEVSRIIAKAARGYYSGPETFKTAQEATQDAHGFRVGFGEQTAWRTFPHEECKPAMQGAGVALAGPSGEPGSQPVIDALMIGFNGLAPDDYESFVLERAPAMPDYYNDREKLKARKEGIFSFCKTEYRAYDPVVVSVLDAARTIAPDAIVLSSDGGNEVFRQMF